MNLLAEIRSRFADALAPLVAESAEYLGMIKPAQDPRFGDYQANCAMPLARRLGRNPRDIAAEIVERLELADLCEAPQVAGPGFINLKLRDDWLEARLGALAVDERLGVPSVKEPRTVVVDYSSPNVAKPMHVGHLRSTVIGDALCRMLRFAGHRVIGDNHVGDWGTQFGMIIYGYKHFLDAEAFAAGGVEELARLYRLVNQLCDYHEARAELPELRRRRELRSEELEAWRARLDPHDKKAKKELRKLETDVDRLDEQVRSLQSLCETIEGHPQLNTLADEHPDIIAATRRETAKLHAGDAENRRLWERFLPICLEALNAMYRRLGVQFDMALGESFYQPMLADVVADLKAAGIAVESQGAVCVFNEGFDAPFIVQKSDGAFTYATSDLATIRYRATELAAQAALYVVDARQSEHFEQLFATARRWGYEGVELRHVKFGTVLDKQTRKPYKTRSGGTVGLEGLLDEAAHEARSIVDANDDAKPDGPELDEATRAAVAEAVGIGGIKYADLDHNRESDYAFDLKKMLAKEGDTATYMQYSCARITGIFRKGGLERESVRRRGSQLRLTRPAERSLAVRLCRLPEELAAALDDYRPNILTQYLFETANAFSTFYEECPVLREPDEAVRHSRLLLCDLTGRAVELGLSLLGIKTCERM